MTMKTRMVGCLAAALLAGPMAAQATVLYDNLNATGPAFNTGLGWTLNTVSDYPTGMRFRATGTGVVTSVDIGLTCYTLADSGPCSPTPSIGFGIHSDSAGAIGPQLGYLSVSVSNSSGNDSLTTGIPTTTTSLVAGTDYWLTALGGSLYSTLQGITWNANNTGALGTRYRGNGYAYDVYYDDTYALGAFRINGPSASVPEPGTIALIGLAGFAGLGFFRRRTTVH